MALVLGMGAGSWVAANNQEDLDVALDRLEALSDELDAAQEEVTGLSRRELAVAEERRARNAAVNELDRVVVAGAKLFAAGSFSSDPVGDDVTALVDDWLRFSNAADVDSLREMFTPDGTVTFIAPFGLRREFAGAEQDMIFAELGRPELEVVGNPLRSGRFVWFRYDETDSSGGVVFRLSGGRIAHQWLVVARNGMGSW